MILHDVKLDYSDVLILPQDSELTSRQQVNLENDHGVVPIIAANMDGVGTIDMAKELAKSRILTALIKHLDINKLETFYAQDLSRYSIYSMGVSDNDYEKFTMLAARWRSGDLISPFGICIDVANGYTRVLEDYVEKVKNHYPEFSLMVGNVVTPERTERLINKGASFVKVGIGPGSVCTTRKLTGVGYPQFSAVLECSHAARSAGGSIIADGGITCPGDAAKAFCAGADYVMIGGMFAGHQEGGGEITSRYEPDGSYSVIHRGDVFPNLVEKEYVSFFGMASKNAQDKYNGGVADYRASEGKEVMLPYRGPVSRTVTELLGGIRSTCTYIGASSISEMHKRASFIRVNRQLNNVYS